MMLDETTAGSQPLVLIHLLPSNESKDLQ